MNSEQKRTLTLLTISNLLCQCSRYVIVYISSVPILGCYDKCSDANFEPLCHHCDGDCRSCQICRSEDGDAKFINMLDGTCITNSQYGWLVGFAFGSIFAVFSLVAGRMVDVYSNRLINTCSIIIWSIAMILWSSSLDFTQVLLSRILLSIAQAFNMPVSINIISNIFNHNNITIANGIYQSGAYIGVCLSALSLLICYVIGWRFVCLLLGLTGIALGIVVYIMIPSSSSVVVGHVSKIHEESESLSESLQLLLPSTQVKSSSTMLIIILLTVSSSLRFIAGLSIAYYIPIYFSRQFLNSQTTLLTFVFIIALSEGIAGSLSSYIGSWIVDRLNSKYSFQLVTSSCLVTAVGAIFAIPCIYSILNIDSFQLASFFLVSEFLVSECWIGPIMADIQVLVAKLPSSSSLVSSHQGLAASLFLFVCTMVGSIGPTIIGSLDDGSASGIRLPMMVVIGLGYGLSSVGFLLIGLAFRE